MMRSRRGKWTNRVGAAVLVGGLLLAGYGAGVTPAGAASDPFSVIIGKLDQILAAITGAPEAEANHTLRWDTHNPSASRFVTAFPGAVLDKNTGLVWEQAPDAAPRTWMAATSHCVNREVPAVGGTRGWRLPSVVELASVQDPLLSAPFVPGNVFTGVLQVFGYWSATSFADFPSTAWVVNFVGDGLVGDGTKAIYTGYAWCVRGGMNAAQY